MARPKVLLADDHTLLLEAFRSLLEDEFEIVGAVSDGAALVEEATRRRPDVIVTDVSILARALQKLEASARRTPMFIPPSVGAVAQVDPLPAFGGGMTKLFSTHPATAERVKRLQQIAARMGQA